MCLSESLNVQYIHSVNMVGYRIQMFVCCIHNNHHSFYFPCMCPFIRVRHSFFVRSFVCLLISTQPPDIVQATDCKTWIISHTRTQLDEMERIIMLRLVYFDAYVTARAKCFFVSACMIVHVRCLHELNSFTQKISI